MLRAMIASKGEPGTRITSSIAKRRVMLWATVKPVTARKRRLRSVTRIVKQISLSEWNFTTNRMNGFFALALRRDVPHLFPSQNDEVTVNKPDHPAANKGDDADDTDDADQQAGASYYGRDSDSLPELKIFAIKDRESSTSAACMATTGRRSATATAPCCRRLAIGATSITCPAKWLLNSQPLLSRRWRL